MASKKKKMRVELRRNRTKPPRDNSLTQQFGDGASGDALSGERVRAKGDLSRRRTIVTGEDAARPTGAAECLPGRVLKVQGLFTYVELADGSRRKMTKEEINESLNKELLTTTMEVEVG